MNIGGNWKRWQAGFDLHGIEQDKPAVEAFFKFKEIWKPTIRIDGGDTWNFGPLRKKADAYEKRDSMKQDVTEGNLWLERFRPTVKLNGNHCQRLWDLAVQGEGIVADYAKEGVEKIEKFLFKMGCQLFPYNKREGVYRMGALKFIHGFTGGPTAARRTALVYGSVAMGHGHAIQMQPIEGLEQRTGFMSGCLCKLELDYNRAQMGTLNQEHGWSYGITNEKTGSFHYWQARKVDGLWILPSDVVQI